ncbi:RDD family protein [Paenibacillus sambharensis]|nr:RDD family protein [Paenibacillus sambharensis]
MHSGFWKRLAAFVLDSVVLYVGYIVFIIIFGLSAVILENRGLDNEVVKIALGITALLFYISWPWLYYAIMESSKIKATVGKLAVGIIVVDTYGQRIRFVRASARNWSKVISALPLFAGFIIAGMTKNKQALHDFIAKTYVINKPYNHNQTSRMNEYPNKEHHTQDQ